jgi:hypothetical protein
MSQHSAVAMPKLETDARARDDTAWLGVNFHGHPTKGNGRQL